MITVIYSYEKNKIDYFFAKRKIKSHKGSNRTNEYKQLQKILCSENVRSIRSKFCYNENEVKTELRFLTSEK